MTLTIGLVQHTLNRGNVQAYLEYLHQGCYVLIDDYRDFMDDATPMAAVSFRIFDDGEWVAFDGDFWLERQHAKHPATLYGEW